MIFDNDKTGTIVKIVYLTEHSVDVLKGREWDFVKQSPCSLDVEDPDPVGTDTSGSGSSDRPESPQQPSSPRREQRTGA